MCISQSKHTFFLIALGGGRRAAAPSAGVSNSMLWKVMRRTLKAENKTVREEKRLQQPQNMTKHFLAPVWDGPKAMGACKCCDWPIWSIVFVRGQRQQYFCRPVVCLIWFHGKLVFFFYYDHVAYNVTSADMSVMKFVLPVPGQYRANFISHTIFLSITTHVSDLAPMVLFGLNNP